MPGQFLHNGKPYNFADIAKNLSAVKRQLPQILTTAALNHFKQSFRDEGFTDKRLVKWAARKAGAPRNKRRGILMDTGFLRNSIRKGRVSFSISEIATSAPYAAAHNEGFDGMVRVRAHTRNRYQMMKKGTGVYSVKTRRERMMSHRQIGGSFGVKAHRRHMVIPQRQFMGYSDILESQMEKLIDERVMSIFNL